MLSLWKWRTLCLLSPSWTLEIYNFDWGRTLPPWCPWASHRKDVKGLPWWGHSQGSDPGQVFHLREEDSVLFFVPEAAKYSTQEDHRVNVRVFSAVCHEVVVLQGFFLFLLLGEREQVLKISHLPHSCRWVFWAPGCHVVQKNVWLESSGMSTESPSTTSHLCHGFSWSYRQSLWDRPVRLLFRRSTKCS